jgi:hypothetical protein
MSDLPWIVSNPIFVGVENVSAPPEHLPATVEAPLFDGRQIAGWRTETDPMSRADLDLAEEADTGPGLRVAYTLAPEPPIRQFAAVAVETPGGLAAYDRLVLRARSERPMRLSIQARAAADGATDERWQRSVYLDEREREVTVDFSDMTPIGVTRTVTPPLDAVHSIVFVVDLTHAKAGSSGRFWIHSASVGR